MSRQASCRGNGRGTIVKRGRIYQARWMIDGKLFTRTTGVSDRREALQILEDYTKPFQAKTSAERARALSLQAEGKDAEIKEYIDDLPSLGLMSGFSAFKNTEEGKRPSNKTSYMYECQYFRFVEWIKAHHPEISELRSVNKQVAREFGDHLSKHFTQNTRKKYLSLLAQIWNAIKNQEEDDLDGCGERIPTREEAAKTARITTNPWERIRDQIKSSPADATRRRPLTIDEIGRIIDSLDGEMRLLFIIGCYTGARLEDCALLEWGQVDLILGQITLVPRKTRKKNPEPRIIPMHRRLIGELYQIPEANRRGYVLPTISARYKKDTSNLSTSIQSIFQKNGITTQIKTDERRAKTIVGFHSLRHFTATIISELGKEGQAQYLLGHTNPEMTQHYNHPRQIALRETINALPDFSQGETPQTIENAPHIDLAQLYAQIDRLPKATLQKISEYIQTALER